MVLVENCPMCIKVARGLHVCLLAENEGGGWILRWRAQAILLIRVEFARVIGVADPI